VFHLGGWASGGGETEAGSGGVEDTVVGVEEDITVDVLGSLADGLDTTEAAAGLRGSGEVEQRAGDGGGVVTNGEGEVWEGGAAGEDVTAVALGVGGTGNLVVVGSNGGVGHQDEGGSGVGDTGETLHGARRRANTVRGGWVLPEAVAAVNIGVDDSASVLGRVGSTEVIGSVSVLGEVSREDGLVEAGLGVIEESLGWGWLHSVDAAEGKTQKSVSGARGEGRRDLVGKLDHLALDGGPSNGDIVSSASAAGSRSVSILDAPGGTGLGLVSGALGGVIDVVSRLVAGGKFGRENPAKGMVSLLPYSRICPEGLTGQRFQNRSPSSTSHHQC
jgi:hypothetical protein